MTDAGTQQERTSMAWERSGFSTMVVGMLLTRYSVEQNLDWFAVVGLAQVMVGAVVLVWSGLHYDDLHRLVRNDAPVIHPLAARLMGLTTVAATGTALIGAVVSLAW